MKISIITVCYNSETTIEDTLKSVLKQTYKDYEYIIVDGKSKDNTLDIIKKYETKFKGRLKWISERDKGLYDAMNKGIKMASGDIVGIINSDDILADKMVFKKIIRTFENRNCDAIYADLVIKDENLDKTVRVFNAKKGNYKVGWYPPHPTLYVKKKLYDKYGTYNQKYKIAADYDFMLRILKKSKLKICYINEVMVHMRSGGISTAGIKGYYKSFKESFLVLKENKIKFPLLVNIIRTGKLIMQVMMAKIQKK